MRESDVRARIDSFLRRAVLPATLGVALAACSGEPTPPGGATKYAAPSPDGATDIGYPATEYMAPMPDAGGFQPLYMAAAPADASAQDDAPAPRYMAVMPDAG